MVVAVAVGFIVARKKNFECNKRVGLVMPYKIYRCKGKRKTAVMNIKVLFIEDDVTTMFSCIVQFEIEKKMYQPCRAHRFIENFVIKFKRKIIF